MRRLSGVQKNVESSKKEGTDDGKGGRNPVKKERNCRLFLCWLRRKMGHSKERSLSLACILHKRKIEEMLIPLKLQGKEEEGGTQLSSAGGTRRAAEGQKGPSTVRRDKGEPAKRDLGNGSEVATEQRPKGTVEEGPSGSQRERQAQEPRDRETGDQAETDSRSQSKERESISQGVLSS